MLGTTRTGGRLALTKSRSRAPRAFHLMAKPTGAVCNLDCKYCFYLTKESLYPGSDFRMSDDILERYVSGLLDAHRGLPEVVVAFQGGEPTMMGLDFFSRVIEIEREYAEPGQRILNTLQTNATLLDDDWGAFLAEHDFLVGVSIDGPRASARRVPRRQGRQADLRPRHARTRRAEAPRRQWNALTTVNASERRARTGGLPIPPRRPGRAVHPAHPDRRA